MGCPGARGVLFFAPHATSDGYQGFRRKTQQTEGHPILPGRQPIRDTRSFRAASDRDIPSSFAAPTDTLTDHR